MEASKFFGKAKKFLTTAEKFRTKFDVFWRRSSMLWPRFDANASLHVKTGKMLNLSLFGHELPDCDHVKGID